MKKSLAVFAGTLFMAALLTGCAQQPVEDQATPQLGMANPASRYCVEQGGRLEIKNEANGQVGYCHLKGEVTEEWTLFRAQQKKCIAEQAATLVGQAKLSDEQIKAISAAEIVRRVGPNQPVTMDYRENRVTVLIDPETQVIGQASCG